MESLLSDQVRLLTLVGVCGLLWSLESVAPLYRYRAGRARQALSNVGLATLLVLTNLALSFSSAYLSAFSVSHGVGLFAMIALPVWFQVVLGIMALDLFAYFAHVLLHKSWLGWQFHRVHHSENAVNVTTAFRQHPGEIVWRILWQLAAIVVFGLPLWLVIVYLILSTFNAQLEHANIKMNRSLDGCLRLLIVTPHMHKVHHSRDQRETDSNYSNIFAFWDRLFGTYTAEKIFRNSIMASTALTLRKGKHC
jgi:sterol desaturase/sphingolipid hydroxylase (fatty acid hydroxylase superfamily)